MAQIQKITPFLWFDQQAEQAANLVPTRLSEMMRDPDPARSQRVVQAMMTMGKLDLPRLEAAYAGR